MRDITTDMIREWIDQCDSQLKHLQNAKDFIHREYYDKDSITHQVEEDLRDYFSNLIRDYKTKKQMLEQMLIHCETENVVEFQNTYGKTFTISYTRFDLGPVAKWQTHRT
jgi:hypothetical protein